MVKAFIRIEEQIAYLTVMDGDRIHSTDSVHVRLWGQLVLRGVSDVWVLRTVQEMRDEW